VDSRAALLKGGESGTALIPGDADKSLLIQALRYAHAEIKMPPDKQLPDKVVADFATWVQQGAVWPATSSRLCPANAESLDERRYHGTSIMDTTCTARRSTFSFCAVVMEPPTSGMK